MLVAEPARTTDGPHRDGAVPGRAEKQAVVGHLETDDRPVVPG